MVYLFVLMVRLTIYALFACVVLMGVLISASIWAFGFAATQLAVVMRRYQSKHQ